MARAHHVKKARKDIPNTDIRAGDSYWWWKFRRGGKRFSKTAPKRSQLTQSEYLSQLYELEDDIAQLPADSSLADSIDDIVSRLRDMASECESKRENMPEQLQDSESGQLLEERKDTCENAADEIEGIDMSPFEADEEQTKIAREDDPDHDEVNSDGDTEEEYWQNKLQEVQDVSLS